MKKHLPLNLTQFAFNQKETSRPFKFGTQNLIILFFFLLFFTPSLFAVDLVVNGITKAGYTDANGTYKPQGTLARSGVAYWKHESKEYYIYYDEYGSGGWYYYWYLDVNTDDEDTNPTNGTIAYSSDNPSSASPVGLTMYDGILLDGSVFSMSIAEYSATPEINIIGNGKTINSGAITPAYTDYTNFGTATTGGGTATRTFTIQNTGASALSVGAISFSGTNVSDFSVTTLPASSVAASGSTTFTVTFTPSAIGNRTATISIVNGDSNENPYTFTISGYGFTAKNLVVSGSTTPSDANGTYVYAGIKNDFPYWKHATLDYYLVNYTDVTGASHNWALDNNFLTTDGYPFYCYSISNVPTGLTWSTLSFLPTGASSYSIGVGTLSVTDATTDPEINVKVGSFDIINGYTGINFYHNTNFGTLDIASGTKTKSFTIENNGTGTLNINGTSPYISLSGTNASEFSVSKAPSNSIAPGSSTTFEITFDPSTVGSKTAVVNISNNDGDEGSYSFNIQGEAITAKNIIVSNITTPAAANGTYTYQGISNDFEYWKNSSGYYVYNYRMSNADDSYDPIWYIDADMAIAPLDQTTYNFKSLNNGSNALPTIVSSWSASTGNAGIPTIMFTEPEINIVGNSLNIISGDNTPSEYDYTDLGWVASGSVIKTFTIQNLGTETLTLTGISPYVVKGGTNSADFSVTTAPSATIAAGGSTTFQVTATPSVLGIRSATLSIASTDADENPYIFSIQAGKGTLPAVTSDAESSIGTLTATGNGTITGLGTPNLTDYGICWNTTGTPTILDSKVSKGAASATSAFAASMTGLTANTTYYVRAYATNKLGTSYGTTVSFTTKGIAPTITTQAVNNIGSTTATGNGNITSLGIPNPTAYGVCWSTTQGAETATGNFVSKGAASTTGAFIASITGLSAGTTYYVKAFATNIANTSYGTEVSFTTKAIPTITWSNPADIAYGALLTATQLNATASVSGTYTYTPASGTKLSVGSTQTLKVDFTPTDLTNYVATSKTVTINVNKATPIITWANPTGIIYGTALSTTQLNATADIAGTFTYTPALGTTLNAGAAQNLKVDFTPTDATNYNTATKTVTIDVAKATPVITWSNPTGITYGTLLSATQLNATADVAGAFTYTPALGTTLNAGTAQNLKADFTPTDATNYNTATKTVTIDVAKATPVITWSNPTGITYGTLLSATQLNATADVAGSMVYTPAIGTKLNAGTGQNLKADFTPTDATNYNTATKTVTIDVVVGKVTPVITWANPTNITYGAALSGTQLNATADVAGSFTYTPALGTILNAGTGQNLKVDFMPTDATNYNTATKTVTIDVAKATPVITWANPAGITYGTALSGTQLNATADVAGTYTYTPALGTILNAGAAQNLKVDFTPTDATNYSTATKTVTIDVVVGKVTPVITWANPTSITYGTALSATQLNATADVAGTFTYTPALGTILNAGTGQNLKVDFIPTDASNYNTATKTVTIDVAKATPVITWANPADINNVTALSNTQLNASSDVAGTFTYTPAVGTKLNVGNAQVLKADFTPSDMSNYELASKTVLINIFLATGITKVENELIVLYPNPAVDAFYVLGFDGQATISLTDLNGKVVLAKVIAADEKVSITNFSSGVYLIKIITSNGTVLKKIVKE